MEVHLRLPREAVKILVFAEAQHLLNGQVSLSGDDVFPIHVHLSRLCPVREKEIPGDKRTC
jgi:hypothetical protein